MVGTTSRLLGRRPFVAYRVVALALLAGLLLATDRALRQGGLPPTHRLPALLLVATGGGLGGILFEFTPREVDRCADLWHGLFPFMEILGNPHWLAGTWLALETLLALDRAPSGRSGLLAAGLGTVLGLVRPYDLVLVVMVHGLSVCVSSPPRDWLRRMAPLFGFLPVALYNYWVFYGVATFSTYTATAYGMPPTTDLLFGLGPAALTALTALGTVPREAGPRTFQIKLWVWTALALVTIVAQPVSFSLQFIVGSGLPLLLLTCLGMSRARPLVLATLAVLSCSTAIVALRIVLRPDPHWHVPAERRQAALALRPHCRSGDLVFSPADIGLYAIGLTSCKAYLSHGWAPGHDERLAVVRSFYGEAPPAERAALLDRLHVDHLVLPGDAGPSPCAWLGESAGFEQVARVASPSGVLSVYTRRR